MVISIFHTFKLQIYYEIGFLAVDSFRILCQISLINFGFLNFLYL